MMTQPPIQYRKAAPADFEGILLLQHQNLVTTLTGKDLSQGYLSIKFTREQLHKISSELGIFVAVQGKVVVGYLMAESVEFAVGSPLISNTLKRLKDVVFDDTPKAASVKALMEAIVDRFGYPSLSKLKYLNDEECEEFLSSLPGVGKKVARCVMLYSLDRWVFPVDTHCWRIASRLGWNGKRQNSNGCTDSDMDHLQNLIPPALRFSLHVNMVSHGRSICTSRKPKCSDCVIADICKKRGLK